MSENEHNSIPIVKALISVAGGTGLGLVTYGIFLYFHIDIFGWNLGLIFAPLVAGYVETIIANRIIGESLGAVSAFILFIYTTFYSFILKNPLLGFNIITAGSIVVILQAAFPTLVNYIMLVVIGGALSKFIKEFKDFNEKLKWIVKKQPVRWETTNPAKPMPYFDEKKSNRKINSLDFYFMTSTDMKAHEYEIIGIYDCEVIIERDTSLIKTEPEYNEQKTLKEIKQGKDESLEKLAQKIKKNGGNGVLNLEINYSLIGMGGDNIQITASGMGVKLS